MSVFDAQPTENDCGADSVSKINKLSVLKKTTEVQNSRNTFSQHPVLKPVICLLSL